MTVLTISAKQLDPEVNYNPFKNIEFNKKVFIQPNLNQEVRKRNLEKLTKLGTSVSILGIVALIPDMTFASPMEIAVGSTNMMNPPQDTIQIQDYLNNPNMIIDFSLKLALCGMGVGFGAAVIFYISQGILKMMGQREKAKQWRRDILDGFGEVLVAVPTISAIWYLAVSIFRSLGVFGNLL